MPQMFPMNWLILSCLFLLLFLTMKIIIFFTKIMLNSSNSNKLTYHAPTFQSKTWMW